MPDEKNFTVGDAVLSLVSDVALQDFVVPAGQSERALAKAIGADRMNGGMNQQIGAMGQQLALMEFRRREGGR